MSRDNKMKWAERHVSGRYVIPHMLVGEAFDGKGDILENHVQIVMQMSVYEALDLLTRLTQVLQSGYQVQSHPQIVMYLKTSLEDDKRGAPDEVFVIDGENTFGKNELPGKRLWLRKELQSDFPAGEPPAFKLLRQVFFHGEWINGMVNFKEEFGWEDYDGSS